jgi:phosphoserine phosphatase RsbU/P
MAARDSLIFSNCAPVWPCAARRAFSSTVARAGVALGPGQALSFHDFHCVAVVDDRYDQRFCADKRFLDLLNVAGRIFYETHFAPLLRMQGFFNEVALDLVTASGARFAVLANALVRRDSENRLLFIRVTLFDAAERRQYERGLVAAKEAAQVTLNEERETAKLREQFIAVLRHDLRNPLTSILGVAEMLLRKPQTEQTKTYLELLVGSAHRISSLIDSLC